MAPDPRLVELFSYYRDGELHGAGMLLRLIKMMKDDPDAQVKLTLHMAEEANHAWLWTKRISDMGAKPIEVEGGYQTRISKRAIPRGPIDLFALTIVVEERSFKRYSDHSRRPNVDDETKRVLQEIMKDEKWHMSWIREKFNELAEKQNAGDRAKEMVEKYRQIEHEAYAELEEKENEAFGLVQ